MSTHASSSAAPPLPEGGGAGPASRFGRRRSAAPPRRRYQRLIGFLLGLSGILAFFGVWEVFAVLLNKPILVSTVTAVASDLWHWIITGQIFPQLKTTVIELAAGYGLGAVVGLLLGMVMALSNIARRILDPLIVGINSAPALALAPLLLIWFGFGLWSKLLLVTFVTIFPILVNTQLGMTGTDPALLEVARSFDSSWWNIIAKVRFMSALPLILASFQVSITRATAAVFAAELFGATSGIGYSILNASQTFDTVRVFSGIIVLSALGVGLTAIVSWIAKKSTPWYGHGR
jgi:NitT/TauT family transport system permease protein